jgi:uncharacterized membrane protein YccC
MKILHAIIYVVRCTLSATLALAAAQWLELPHPVWASVSALVVSQDRIEDTRASLSGRLLGTLTGVAIAILVGSVARLADIGSIVQLAGATILCASIVRARPDWRVCMWTAAIVLLTATPQQPVISTGLLRGAEVLLGGLIGTVAHELATFVAVRVGRKRVAPDGVR